MARVRAVSPEVFAFFRKLKKNNRREWFQENKAHYEERVRAPLLELISDFAPELEKLSPHLVADPRPSGGSMFRIHRDVRFSPDKSPYKTAAGIWFYNEARKELEAPGYYLHLEPGSVFAAGGIWHPAPETLRKIRDAIAADGKSFERAVDGKAFRAAVTLDGDRLKRAPKGYPPDHPQLEHLMWKDFTASAPFAEDEACAPDFTRKLAKTYRAMVPMMRFLSKAVGAKF